MDYVHSLQSVIELLETRLIGKSEALDRLRHIRQEMLQAQTHDNQERECLRREVARLTVYEGQKQAIYKKWARAFLIHCILDASKVTTQTGYNRKLNRLNKMSSAELRVMWEGMGKPEPQLEV